MSPQECELAETGTMWPSLWPVWCPSTDGKAAFEMDFKVILSFLALKKAFAENEEIQEMAQNNFIMLNLMV